MIEIGKGVAVDFEDKPSVFLIQGYGEIRIQKGATRINGVTLEQLELIVKRLKDAKLIMATDNIQDTTPEVRAVSSGSPKPRASSKSKSKQASRI